LPRVVTFTANGGRPRPTLSGTPRGPARPAGYYIFASIRLAGWQAVSEPPSFYPDRSTRPRAISAPTTSYSSWAKGRFPCDATSGSRAPTLTEQSGSRPSAGVTFTDNGRPATRPEPEMNRPAPVAAAAHLHFTLPPGGQTARLAMPHGNFTLDRQRGPGHYQLPQHSFS